MYVVSGYLKVSKSTYCQLQNAVFVWFRDFSKYDVKDNKIIMFLGLYQLFFFFQYEKSFLLT